MHTLYNPPRGDICRIFIRTLKKKSEGPSERIAFYNAKRHALSVTAQHTYKMANEHHLWTRYIQYILMLCITGIGEIKTETLNRPIWDTKTMARG